MTTKKGDRSADGSETKKIRESEGGAFEHRGKFYVRVTVSPQKRLAKRAPWATTLEEAEARGELVQQYVNRLREAGKFAFVENALETGAKANEEELSVLADMVDAATGGRLVPVDPKKREGGPVTFRVFAERWINGELHRLYPDHVPTKKSAADDEYRVEVLNEIVGQVPLVSFTLDHADEAMRSLDETRRKRAVARGQEPKPKVLEPGARRQYAQLLNRVLKLAAYPARIIKASPLPTGWLPRVSNNKAKGLLYPDEEATTLACTKHEIHWRVFFGFLARSGFRVDEAAGLTIADVDLVRGVVTLDENKTDDPRAPTYGPEVMIALRLWKERYRAGAKKDELLFVRPDGNRIRVDGLAEFYREHFVRDAGIDRPELFAKRTRSRLALRVHDLRGFFVTYALAGGRSETWVMDRTGHKSSTMVNRYRRVARTVAEAGLGSPVPLHMALPEFAAAFTAANAAAKGRKRTPRRRASARNQKVSGPIAQSVELRTFNP